MNHKEIVLPKPQGYKANRRVSNNLVALKHCLNETSFKPNIWIDRGTEVKVHRYLSKPEVSFKSKPAIRSVFPSYFMGRKDNEDTDKSEDLEFVNKINQLYQLDNRNMAVKLVYSYFGKLILEKKFERCDQIIKRIISENYITWLLLPFLTLTRPYREQISSRSILFGNAVIHFNNTLSKSQFESTVNRLK